MSGEDKVFVKANSGAQKGIQGLSVSNQDLFELLKADLYESRGKLSKRHGWDNFGSLKQEFKRYGKTASHCHLTRSTVVKWRILEDTPDPGALTVLIYYVGKREGAY